MKASLRLSFEKLSALDRALSISMSMDESIMKFITGKALSQQEAEERFGYQLKTNVQHPGLGFFKAINKTSTKVIGYLKIVKEAKDIMEIGYAVLPEYRGKGFAREMTEAMMNYTSSGFLEVKKLLGTVDQRNMASAHILEAYGFSVEKEELSGDRTILHFTKPV
ncbi:GNAT family N-acetyltransferase [Jiulongibacter sediminis]|jgi:ribosomal-protein-alanine N-acetyltransferase|uniref:GNAT family N-acetyltransferase n=1 Tax=Jiulongibacter sediminis TaxID=1605367 RepID=UPI0026E92E4D|nr:GNAT family N-acetyltransferase [Jiulongibacter sediminis]